MFRVYLRAECIDAQDEDGHWCEGQIYRIDGDGKRHVRFKGFSSKYDIAYERGSPKIMPLGTHTYQPQLDHRPQPGQLIDFYFENRGTWVKAQIDPASAANTVDGVWVLAAENEGQRETRYHVPNIRIPHKIAKYCQHTGESDNQDVSKLIASQRETYYGGHSAETRLPQFMVLPTSLPIFLSTMSTAGSISVGSSSTTAAISSITAAVTVPRTATATSAVSISASTTSDSRVSTLSSTSEPRINSTAAISTTSPPSLVGDTAAEWVPRRLEVSSKAATAHSSAPSLVAPVPLSPFLIRSPAASGAGTVPSIPAPIPVTTATTTSAASHTVSTSTSHATSASAATAAAPALVPARVAASPSLSATSSAAATSASSAAVSFDIWERADMLDPAENERRGVEFSIGMFQQGFRIYSVASDGHCMFRSVSHQVFGTVEHHHLLRTATVQLLRLDHDRFRDFAACEDDDQYETYLRSMENIRDARWAGQLELQAMAVLLNRDIRVYSYHPEGGARIITNSGIKNSAPPILLAFLGGNHFDSVVHADVVHRSATTPSAAEEELERLLRPYRRGETASLQAAATFLRSIRPLDAQLTEILTPK